MIETEVKIKLTEEEFRIFTNLLGRPNFFNQENIIYNIPEGFVRIRKENGQKIITLKKPYEGEFNSRKEIEFQAASNTPILKDFFKELGLKEDLAYKKRRANILKNKCTISLDVIGKNNYYIEIEGDTENIKTTIKELNLQDHKLETRAYSEILK